jgi:Kelch motif
VGVHMSGARRDSLPIGLSNARARNERGFGGILGGASGVALVLALVLLPASEAQAAGPGTWTPTGAAVFSPGLPTLLVGCLECSDAEVLGPQLLLRLGNGNVLGMLPTDHGTVAELYDPIRNAWSLTTSPVFAPTLMTLLPSGQVLAVQGTSAELYDPLARTWRLTGSAIFAPSEGGSLPHDQNDALTLLPNGKVLAMSGTSVELYDPRTGTWARTASVPVSTDGSGSGSATLLQTGEVLVAGGCCVEREGGGGDTFGAAITSAELYDPATDTWRATGSMNESRYTHSATLLANGKVLVGSGMTAFGGPCCAHLDSINAEVYDPASGTWSIATPDSTAALLFGTQAHSATLLSDGSVLVLDPIISENALFHPATNSIGPTGSKPPAPGLGVSTAVLQDGRVLVSGNPPQVYTPLSPALPSSCTLSASGIDRTGHAFIKVAARNVSSGLRSISVVLATNATIIQPKFPQGSRDPAVLTATKLNSSLRSTVTLQVTSMDGASVTCDPIIAQLGGARGQAGVNVFRDVLQSESKLTLTNGQPGLDRVEVLVDGRRFELRDLRPGEVRTLDVGAALRRPTHNTIVVIGHGARDGTALLVIAG